MKVAVSIFSLKTSKERIDMINKINKSDADYIHFDVADGAFVDSKYLCIPELVKLIKLSKKKNDVHLMVEDPIKYIEQIKSLNVDNITIHVEINKALKGIINYIKENKIKVGLAIDLNTSIDAIKPYIKEIDRVLIMSVKAGRGGQEFEPQVLEKIKRIPANIEVEVDGGINDTVIKYLKGVDIVVAGTYAIKDLKNIEKLR